MERSAVFGGLQPNYLVYPSRNSSSLPFSGHRARLPNFSPPPSLSLKVIRCPSRFPSPPPLLNAYLFDFFFVWFLGSYKSRFLLVLKLCLLLSVELRFLIHTGVFCSVVFVVGVKDLFEYVVVTSHVFVVCFGRDTFELADIDWDDLGFAYVPTDYMYSMKCTKGGNFSKGELQRYGNIELNPSAGVLNYGQVFLSFIYLFFKLYVLN